MNTSILTPLRTLLAAAALGIAASAGAQVIPPPILDLTATPIAPGAISTVAFTITNPNAFSVEYYFDIPMPYPTVEALGTPPGSPFTGSGCGNGSSSLGNDRTSGRIFVNAGTSNSCTYTFYASSTAVGLHTITASTTQPLDTAAVSADLEVFSVPTATVTFSPALILGNQSTLLTLTITNPDPDLSLTLFGSIDLGPLTNYAMDAVGNPAGCLSGGFDGPLYFETWDWQTQLQTSIPPGGSCSLELVINNAPPYVPPSPPPPSLPAGSYTVPYPPTPPSTPPLINGDWGGGDVGIPVSFPVTAGILQVTGISVSPSVMSFASQSVGTTSSPQSVTVTNVGDASLNISGVSVSGDFAATSDCTALSPLAPYATCDIVVTFSPLIAGDRAGQVTVSSDDPTVPAKTVPLGGLGVAVGSPTLSITPSRLAFPAVVAGSRSSPQVVTVANTGPVPVTIDTVETGDGFLATHDCGQSLVPRAACSIAVVFSPSSVWSYATYLEVRSTALGSPHRVDLVGQGAPAPQAQLSASPGFLAFGDQVVGTAGAPRRFSIVNVGDASAIISSIVATGDFSVSGTCGSLAPGWSCEFLATFRPTAVGVRSGTVEFASDARNSPLVVGLGGTGIPVPVPRVALSASTLGFGNALVGSSSSLSLRLTNAGAADLVLGTLDVTGSFVLASGCPGILPPNASCDLAVRFLPSMSGSLEGRLTIPSNADGSPHAVGLSGTGCRLAFVGRSLAVVCTR